MPFQDFNPASPDLWRSGHSCMRVLAAFRLSVAPKAQHRRDGVQSPVSKNRNTGQGCPWTPRLESLRYMEKANGIPFAFEFDSAALLRRPNFGCAAAQP
jgi:hypothetical protein